MKMFTLLFIAILITTVQAQEETTPHYGWKNTLITGLNITQVSLNNWAQGGENTLAYTFLSNGRFEFLQESYTWTNNLKLTYGQAKIGKSEFEKVEDELYFESMYARNIGWAVNPYVALIARTQLAPGYKIIDGIKTQTSTVFDPGYLMQTAGFTYTTGEAFTTRLGAAVKETFASGYYRFGYADDPKTSEIEKSRVQTGIESGTSVKYGIMENMLFSSQLNFFSAFNQLDVWDVRWDNTLVAKVNNYVNASLNVQIVHEIAQTRRTQLKESLALGFTYSLF